MTRLKSLDTIINREPIELNLPKEKISKYFATNVFTDEAMEEFLPEEAYISVKSAIESGKKIDRQVADQVASSMKAWALGRGCTHYTHWFQPLTGATAEKHDAFFTPTENGKGIEHFNGSILVQQEPDASSFPNGGLRNTFEARGYTAWDPSSPAFIMDIGAGKTLCIPTVFIAYTGEALDYKAPLLKSSHYIESAALEVCQLFDKNVSKVVPTLGWEQEYFLVDEALYYSRPDLTITGRTVFGSSPAKGQQLDDHYFGSIHERVYAYMLDLETESLKLGIPVRTRHNEVAPSQFECAPQYEEVNLAIDHNSLLMDLMERIAKRHKLRILLHEKPYAGINGSGKHNNWSLGTNTGKNLLSPGNTPKTNLQFLTFFINTIKAVHDHDDLLRASIASAGNDFRLGANEAPPAIISIFIGSHLTEVLNDIESRVEDGKFTEQDKSMLKLDIHLKIPDLMLDNTDRNRTSPFAFTGNKFEIRAVGSTANCANPMTIMNTIVGNQLKEFSTEVKALIKKGEKKDSAILQVLRGYISHSRKILFEGDGYSQDWEKEAEQRGLTNIKTTPQALDAYMSEATKEVFTKTEVLSETELEARQEIAWENYILKVQIESRIGAELATNHIIPAALKYQNSLLENLSKQNALGLDGDNTEWLRDSINSINEHVNGIKTKTSEMLKERGRINDLETARDQAIGYCDIIRPAMEEIRYHVDKLEFIVDDAMWPLAKYRELLFIR